MNDLSDVQPEHDSDENEIESPVDGPTPDWMKTATSAGESAFDEDKAPDWLKAIRSGKGASPKGETKGTAADSGPTSTKQEPADDDSMSDLERLLAEEGIDLNTVAEDRPEGAEGMSAKDWLISTSDDDLVRKRLDEAPVAETPPSPEAKSAPPAPRSQPAEDVGVSDIERLLAEEGIDLSAVDEDRPEGAEGMSAKDWLISTSDDDLVRKRLDETPAAETPPSPELEPSLAAPASEPDEDGMVFSDDLPDWLREEADEEPVSDEPTREVAPLAPAPVDEDDDRMVISEDLPDWLQETDEEEPVFAEASVSPPFPESTALGADDSGIVVSEELPDWLQDVPEEEETSVVGDAAAMSASSADKMVVEEGLPDWLQDFEEEEGIGEPADLLDTQAVSDDDLPDWLRSVETEPAEPEIEAVSEPEASSTQVVDDIVDEEGLPDWLREVQIDEAEEAASASLPVIEPNDEDLPDWLKNVQAEQQEEALAAKAEPVAEAEAVSSDAADIVTEEDLPDWLKDVSDEEEFAYEAETLVEATALESDIVDEAGLPDWLQEVELEEDELFEPSEPSPEPFADMLDESLVVEEELPDWLQEVQQEAEVEMAEAGTMLARKEGAPDTAAKAEDDLIDHEGLPDWLRDVEEETEPLAVAEATVPEVTDKALGSPAAEAEPEPVAEPLISAEDAPVAEEEEAEVEAPTPVAPAPEPVIAAAPAQPATTMPDWLKKLREGSLEAEETPVPARPVPATRPAVAAAPAAFRPEAKPVKVELRGDADEHLKLARTARDEGSIDEAIRLYDALVASGTHLDVVIEDIQHATKSYPANYLLYQVMGDAMMRDGRLQSALEAYRNALAKL